MQASRSIKQTLPQMMRLSALLLLVLILPVNIWFQFYTNHESQYKESQLLFAQLERLISENQERLFTEEQRYTERAIQAAEVVAFIVDNHPSIIKSQTQLQILAQKYGLDEIHIFSPQGKIFAGTHTKYYGLTFESGEQIGFFAPMLKDRSLKLCQGVTPNTAEGIPMQYSAVWAQDGSVIVQVGLKPERLLKVRERQALDNLIFTVPLGAQGSLMIFDRDSQKVVASTIKRVVGTDLTKVYAEYGEPEWGESFHYDYEGQNYCVYMHDYGKYRFISFYSSHFLTKKVLLSTLLVLFYIGTVALVIMGLVSWYVKRKLADNLAKIAKDLRHIEEGKLEAISSNTGILEFEEVTFYANKLLQSVRLNLKKIASIIEKGKMPVGFFVDNHFYKRYLVNDRLLSILGVDGTKDTEALRDVIIERLKEAEDGLVDSKENVYFYNRNGTRIYLRIEKESDEQGDVYYVSDVSNWWSEIYLLRGRSNQDELTGLYNRRGYTAQVAKLFAEPGMLGFSAVIMVDADGLKKINDVYGHHVGDNYLQEVANIIKSVCGKNAVCARLGGDEFAIFIYKQSSYESIDMVIAELKSRRHAPFDVGREDVIETVEFSLGCAVYPRDSGEFRDLMHLADENMYLEKHLRKMERLSRNDDGELKR